jgi:hypothetical protein
MYIWSDVTGMLAVPIPSPEIVSTVSKAGVWDTAEPDVPSSATSAANTT